MKRWARRSISERAGSQSHFNDLCDLLGVPKPTDNPATDSDYCFEAQTEVSAAAVYSTEVVDGLPIYQVRASSGGGFADVWMRDHFCWEYKRPDKCKTLDAALVQLKIYKDSLGNPPLLVVCDNNRFEIHTNFTGYPPTTYRFNITDLTTPPDEWKRQHPTISPLEVLRKVFGDPSWFRPAKTTAAITEERATDIGQLAIALRDAGNEPHAVAHFLMQIVFCFFAEDIGLLPHDLFTDLIDKSRDDAANFPTKARRLFMAMEVGGSFGSDTIEWFNGGLFSDVESDPIINIASVWLAKLLLVARSDWDTVEPAILGTLFERSLDPDKRSQIGAHYTSRDDIMLIVEPVVMQPLRQRWLKIQSDVWEWLGQRAEKETKRAKKRINEKIEKAIVDFVDHLGTIRILDPACGSGNFLYVAIQQLLALEHEVRAFSARPEIGVTFTPRVHPGQLHGIEINDYAAELARVSIWIGYLQWLHANADSANRRPILDPLDTIECRDAILKWEDAAGNAIPGYREAAVCASVADWPETEFIIGNPPFLGSKLFRKWGLPDPYIDAMYASFELPNTSDLCCYWFEIGRMMIASHGPRIGLLATQGIRGGDNRTVLQRVEDTGGIFMAWSDRPWILDGAAVHVSMVGFDNGLDTSRSLNGLTVVSINSDLSAGTDIRSSRVLASNEHIAFMGSTKGGKFELSGPDAQRILSSPNPHGRSDIDVLRPWINGTDVTKRPRGLWIVDFGTSRSITDSAQYEAAFSHIERAVKPERTSIRQQREAELWWLHNRARGDMRRAIRGLRRFLVTTRVAKHRLFRWFDHPTLPDSATFCFARADDCFFGVLQSTIHELWARRAGTQLREVESGFRYTPTTCFETFPLPWAPGAEPTDNRHYIAISDAAKELNELRENWLNPRQWIEAVEIAVDSFEDFSEVPEEARALLRHSAIMARAAKDPNLKKRTLTNLYNERPAWLKLAHKKLDEAVLHAYAEIDPDGNWDSAWAAAYEPFGAGEIVIVRKEDVKGKRAKPDPANVIAAKEAAIEERKEIDEQILVNLLRMNLQRAKLEEQTGKRDH